MTLALELGDHTSPKLLDQVVELGTMPTSGRRQDTWPVTKHRPKGRRKDTKDYRAESSFYFQSV